MALVWRNAFPVFFFFIPAVGVRGILKLIQSKTGRGTADRSGAGSSWPHIPSEFQWTGIMEIGTVG